MNTCADEARKMVHRSQVVDAPWLPPQQPGYGVWVEVVPGSSISLPAKTEYAYLSAHDRATKSHLFKSFTLGFASGRWWSDDTVAICVKLGAAQVGAQFTGHAIQPSNSTRHHTPKPIPADFIHWAGKGVPNIPAGTRVRYLTRSGADGETAVHCIGWTHDGGPMDVIAYRPLHDADAQMLLRDMADHKPRPVCTKPASDEALAACARAFARRSHDARVSAAAWVERPRDHRLGSFN